MSAVVRKRRLGDLRDGWTAEILEERHQDEYKRALRWGLLRVRSVDPDGTVVLVSTAPRPQ